jgi:hypothetical protein
VQAVQLTPIKPCLSAHHLPLAHPNPHQVMYQLQKELAIKEERFEDAR